MSRGVVNRATRKTLWVLKIIWSEVCRGDEDYHIRCAANRWTSKSRRAYALNDFPSVDWCLIGWQPYLYFFMSYSPMKQRDSLAIQTPDGAYKRFTTLDKLITFSLKTIVHSKVDIMTKRTCKFDNLRIWTLIRRTNAPYNAQKAWMCSLETNDKDAT